MELISSFETFSQLEDEIQTWKAFQTSVKISALAHSPCFPPCDHLCEWLWHMCTLCFEVTPWFAFAAPFVPDNLLLLCPYRTPIYFYLRPHFFE